MENLTQSVKNIFISASRAFKNYPVVLISALLFALITAFSISLGVGDQTNDFQLFLESSRLALALAAMFGLAVVTWAKTRQGTEKAFKQANILAAGVGLVTFLILFFFSRVIPDYSYGTPVDYYIVHPTAGYRVTALIIISILAFILAASHPDEEKYIAKSLIMTVKAFFQGFLFGLVINLGALAIMLAINALLFETSDRMYGYITVFSVFVGFSIFIGYFPDFKKEKSDPSLLAAMEKPRFLEVLLDYILVPIMLALTLVLLLWAGSTALQGMDTDFPRLYSIATGYAVAGLILHLLVTHSQSGLARFYLKVFPIVVLPILAFEAWALIIQVQSQGLRTMEYLFILGWIVTLVAAVLLILKQHKAHPLIIYVISATIVFAILPLVGFSDLPVRMQVSRLEGLLESQGMLEDNAIQAAEVEPDQETREAISNSVEYLVYLPYVEYPEWLDKEALRGQRFESIMGFASTVRQGDGIRDYWNLSLYLPNNALDISGYQWSIMDSGIRGSNTVSTITGSRGRYEIHWNPRTYEATPELTVFLEGEVIAEEDFSSHIQALKTKYPFGTQEVEDPDLEDLTWTVDMEELQLDLILRTFQVIGEESEPNYYMELAAILISEKP